MYAYCEEIYQQYGGNSCPYLQVTYTFHFHSAPSVFFSLSRRLHTSILLFSACTNHFFHYFLRSQHFIHHHAATFSDFLRVSSLHLLTRNGRTQYLVFCHTSKTFLTVVFQNSNPSFVSTNSKHVPFRAFVFYWLAHRPRFCPYIRSILGTSPPLPAPPILLFWRKDEHHPLNGCKISTSSPWF
jgi:hypothetical protein